MEISPSSNNRMFLPKSPSHKTSHFTPFSTVAANALAAPTPTNVNQTSPPKSWDLGQDNAQRNATFPSLNLIEKPSPSSLKKALEHYKRTQDQSPTSDLKKPLERIVGFFISTPDPKIQQFNELHTLYSKAIHVCGDTLRPLIQEDEMQQSLETVWHTGKVNMTQLESYEKTILEAVHTFLNPSLEAAARG